VFATTNAGAAIGENIAQLVARYGEPENGLALMMGFGTWKTKQGEVNAILQDGKAALMAYNGGVDDETKNALLERNLPSDQKWLDGKAFKEWVLSFKELDPDSKEVEKIQCWQTTDGRLWALYSPVEKNFFVGTPEGFKMVASLAQSRATGGH